MPSLQAHLACCFLVCFVGAPAVGAADEASPITLREAEDEGGWFLFQPHDGTLDEMGSAFARFALLGSRWGDDPRLTAVLLDGNLRGPTIRAQVGVVLATPPPKVPPAYRLRFMRPARVAVGRGSGNWGKASTRIPEVRAWAGAVGFEVAGSPRVVFVGDPSDPGSLRWEVRLPVRPAPPPEEETSSGEEPGTDAGKRKER